MFINMYFKVQNNAFRLWKEHKEMESARDLNVDLPDRHQVWEAPSPTRSNAGPLPPPPASFSPESQGDTSDDWQI